jgi:hypothetical protein
MEVSIYKERHIYIFPCEACGRKDSRTFKRSLAKKRKCRNCRKNKLPKNQMELFHEEETKVGIAYKLKHLFTSNYEK